jgi:hypothetical protein
VKSTKPYDFIVQPVYSSAGRCRQPRKFCQNGPMMSLTLGRVCGV